MQPPNSRAVGEAEIRALIDDRIKAVRAKDVNGAVSSIAPDVVSFDVVNPLRYSGLDAIRRRLAEWFSAFEGPIGYEVRDLNIAAADDVAFSHCLSRVSATRIDGRKLDMWWRTTFCYRKIDGKWVVTHEHDSVPFDMESGRASLDLKP